MEQSKTSWPGIEREYGSILGYASNEIRGMLRMQFPSGATDQQAASYIRKKYDLAALEQMNASRSKLVDEYAPTSPAEWARTPTRRRGMEISAVPYAEGKDLPDDYVRVKDERWVANQRDALQHGYYARQGGAVGITAEQSKILKRDRLHGHNPYGEFSNLPVVGGGFRAGPGSRGVDQFQITRSAVVVSGSVAPPGERHVDPRLGPYRERFTKRVTVPINQPLPTHLESGTNWSAGQSVSLADGFSPIKTDPHASYSVLNRRSIYDEAAGVHGFEYAMQKMTPLDKANTAGKSFGIKQQDTLMDLSGVRSASTGQYLGLRTLEEGKDWGGIAYSYWQAKGHDYTLSKLNALQTERKLAPLRKIDNYGSLGDLPLEAFHREVEQEGLLQEIYVPKTMTKERYLERLAKTDTTGYAGFKVTDAGDGLVSVREKAWALVMDKAQQTGRDYDPRSNFLSRNTLRNIAPHNPGFVREALARSRDTRRAYREAVNSALATAGTHQAPHGAVNISSLNPQAVLARTAAAAREGYRAEGRAVPEDIPREVLQRHFLDQMRGQTRPMMANVGSGNVYLPSGQSIAHFGAQGQRLGEEVAPLIGGSMQLFEALAGGDQKSIEAAASRYRTAIGKLGAGQKSIIKAKGAFLPSDMMSGMKAKGSDALAPNEVFFPELALADNSNAVHVMGFPEWGDEGAQAWKNISRARAREMGLNPRNSYISQEVAQGAGRDFDGDNIYALLAGKGAIQRDRQGNLIAPGGQRITKPGEAQALANRALVMGHGDLRGEMATYQPRENRAGIMGKLRDGLVPNWVTQSQFVQSIKQQSELYGKIGPYYNTFTRGLATSTDAGRGTMNELFWYSHGFAQRPKELPRELQDFHKLSGAGTSSWYGGTLNKRNRYAALSFGEARGKYLASLTDLKRAESDAPFLSAGKIADVMLPAGSDRREGFISAVDSYRETGRGFNAVLGAAGEGHEDVAQWVEGTDTGRLYAGKAYQRRSKDTDILGALKAAGFSDDQAERIGVAAEQSHLEQARVIASTRKHRTGNLQQRIAQAGESADAAGGFVRRITQQSAPAAAQLPDEVGTPSSAGGSGGDGGKKPPTTVATPDDSGWKKNDKGGSYRDIPAQDDSGGGQQPAERRPMHEIVAPRISPNIVKTLSYLNEQLPTYAGDLKGSGLIKKGSELHKVATKGADAFLNIQDWEAKIGAIANDTSAPQNQRLAAKQIQQQYFDGGRIRGEDLESAFNRFMDMSAEDGGFEILQGIQKRRRGQEQGKQKYGQVLLSQRARGQGVASGRREAQALSFIADSPFRAAADVRETYVAKDGARDLIQRRSELMSQYKDASGAEQRRLAPQINEVAESMKALKEEVSPLVEAVKAERVEIRENIKMRQSERTNVQSLLGRKTSQLHRAQTNMDSLKGATDPEQVGEREYWQREERKLSGQISALERRERGLSRSIGEETGRLEGLEMPSLAGMRTGGVRAPRSLGSRFGSAFAKAYDPQRLFYQSQMMAQGYYMIGMPLMNTREQYLQSEFSRGRMEFALGMGGTGAEVSQLRRQQAIVGNLTEGIGQGVNQAVAPWIDLAGGFAQGNEGAAPGLGKALTYGVAGLGAATAFRMTGAGSLASWGAKSGWGALAAKAPVVAGGLTTAAAIGGVAAGGAGIGAAAYEGMRLIPKYRDFYGIGDLSASQSFKNFRGLAGYAWDTTVGGDSQATAAKRWGEYAYGKGYDKPIPVEIVDLRKEVADMLGGQVDKTKAGEITTAFAEATGMTEAGLSKGSAGRQMLGNISNMALKAGLDPEQLASFIGKAPQAFGVGVGSPHTMRLMEMFTGVQSVPRLESLMSSAQSVSGAAQKVGVFGQVDILARQYDEIRREQGTFAAERYKSRMTLGSRHDWSVRAYAGGMDGLAMMDETQPWRPKYEREQFAIQDRRRREDLTTSLGAQYSVGVMASGFGIAGFSGGRQAAQIGWQEQQNALGQEQFAFQQLKRGQNYGFQIRQNDLTRKQMLYNLDREQKYSSTSNWYQGRQFKINEELFDLQTGYRLQDFDTRERRMETQRGWQLEDFGLNRDTFEMQAGWQQDDARRALRYSSGRKRLDIRRQMERQSTLNNIQRGKMDTAEGRADTQYEWKEDDLARDRERFDEIRPLQKEQMELSKQYWEMQKELGEEDRAKRREFAMEQLGLMDDRHEAWKGNYDTETDLINQQHELETEMKDAKLQWDKDDLARARERAAEDEKTLGWQRKLNEAQQIYNAYAELGAATVKKWRGDIKAILDYTKNLAAIDLSALPGPIMKDALVPGVGNVAGPPSPNQQSTPSPGRYMLPSYDMGGRVAATGPAIIHKDEFVVPIGGALVQGSGQQAELLSAILSVLTQMASDNGKEIVIELDGEKVGDVVVGGLFNNAYQ